MNATRILTACRAIATGDRMHDRYGHPKSVDSALRIARAVEAPVLYLPLSDEEAGRIRARAEHALVTGRAELVEAIARAEQARMPTPTTRRQMDQALELAHAVLAGLDERVVDGDAAWQAARPLRALMVEHEIVGTAFAAAAEE